MNRERISNMKIYSDWKDNSRRLLLVNGADRLVGDALLKYYSWPLPLFEVGSVFVTERYRGKGYGSAIMNAVEAYLKRKKKTGVLSDAIMPNEPAAGMYERRGWVPIVEGDFKYAFNVPEKMPPRDLYPFYLRRMERGRRKIDERRRIEREQRKGF